MRATGVLQTCIIEFLAALYAERGLRLNTRLAYESDLCRLDVFLTDQGIESLHDVVLILASNRHDLIDPAILRPGRIDRKIKVERPDFDASREIFGIYIAEELPLDAAEVAARGGVAQARGAIIDVAVKSLFARTEETKFLTVSLRSGRQEALYFGGLASGALIDNIVQRSKEMAIKRAIAGELDYKAKRQPKLEKVKLNTIEQMMAFETAKGYVAGKAGPHYPAPVEAIKVIQKGAGETRARAQAIEAKSFAKLALSSVAFNLVGLFINDQVVKKKGSKYEKQAQPVKQTAVLGAGIMGGGIAYQSASKGTPILMKDIKDDAIELGLKEARKLFSKQVERKKLTTEQMAEKLSNIRPTLSYGDFGNVDLVVEAVVENPNVKDAVLTEVEGMVGENAILTSNTSTISINRLAKNLKRPENFCGMHFFNPVHRMPLVEVIRGEKTSDAAVAATVAYARAMGKTPIVVNDCPGFLVNRVLFPYFGGFSFLVEQGADFQRVDKVMEKFGWPMGPAYLLDVVGMDTAVHANEVMAEGFPDRMAREGKTAIQVMYDNKRLGQKNDKGFYAYEEDKKGKPKKVSDEQAYALVKEVVKEQKEFSDEDIIARMMVPLCLETVRCLEDGIVDTPAEADMALIYGIGFPPFRGGALRYIDALGVAEFVALADRLAQELGPLYAPTEKLRAMAQNNEQFYAGTTANAQA